MMRTQIRRTTEPHLYASRSKIDMASFNSKELEKVMNNIHEIRHNTNIFRQRQRKPKKTPAKRR